MSRNPEYEFIQTDVDALIRDLISGYEHLCGVTVHAASPERLFIQWVANIVLQERVLTNYTGNQNIPSRADGANLDALGELFYTQVRPEAQAAVCTERFRISKAQSRAVLIPKGTRVTDTGGALVWETTDDAYITAGQLFVDVPIRCQTAGVIGNGWEEGQISVFVDLYDYCESCANITVSDSGADRASDAEFYELLRASMDAYSTAGSEGAYVYHAKSVSTEIGDVKAIRPKRYDAESQSFYTLNGKYYAFFGGNDILPGTLALSAGGNPAVPGTEYAYVYEHGLLTVEIVPGSALETAIKDGEAVTATVAKVGAGEVEIYVLMDDGTAATEEIRNAVFGACSDETVRPLTDCVSVCDPGIAEYAIDMTYYIPRGLSGNSALIQAKVADAVEAYKAWQSEKLGRDINPSKLTDMVMGTGVKRVVIRSPEYTPIADGSDGRRPAAALCVSAAVVNGGVEEE